MLLSASRDSSHHLCLPSQRKTSDVRPFALIFPRLVLGDVCFSRIQGSLLARAPVRSSLNLWYRLPPCPVNPPPQNIFSSNYTIHISHLFWFQNGEFRQKMSDFHACVDLLLPELKHFTFTSNDRIKTKKGGK